MMPNSSTRSGLPRSLAKKRSSWLHVKTVHSDAELVVRVDGTEVLHTNYIRAAGDDHNVSGY